MSRANPFVQLVTRDQPTDPDAYYVHELTPEQMLKDGYLIARYLQLLTRLP